MPIWQAILLGFLEGLTEFLPVSSTGHLLLAGHFLGFESPAKTFEVQIQLGAILAVVVVYFGKLWQMLLALPSDPWVRRFIISLFVAFLPAAVFGALLHGFIKDVLFENPVLVCAMLIVGGFVLLAVDRWLAPTPRFADAMDIPPARALGIGFFQCLALVPGVSRSGATIVGGLLMGAERRAAAEFSFLLALPTMSGAFAYDLYVNWNKIESTDVLPLGIGFVMAFLTAVVVIKLALDFIARHGFTPFAWWRIVVGSAGLAALAIYG